MTAMPGHFQKTRLVPAVFAFIAAVAVLTAVPSAAASGPPRSAAFDRIVREERLLGDVMAATLFARLAPGPPSLPPALQGPVKPAYAEYATRYESYRARLKQALERRDYPASEQWRVDRTEADLHLVAYEMSRPEPIRASVIQKYLSDARWALDHTISPVGAERTKPPLARIAVDPSIIQAGDEAVLTWSVEGADRVTIDGEEVPSSGARRVTPGSASEYRLEAVGPGGRTEDEAIVDVLPYPAPVVEIRADPPMVQPGRPSLIRWRAVNATEAVINGEAAPLEGERTISPFEPVTFVFAARGPGGRAAARATVDVVSASPLVRVEVVPEHVAAGECAQVVWRAIRASMLSMNGVVVPLSGTRRVCPASSTTYDFEATGPGGTTRASAAVVVTGAGVPPPARIHFDFGRAAVREDALDTLAAVAARLASNPEELLTITGYCDAVGSEPFNSGLSLRRARAVRDHLARSFGIDPARCRLAARGEDNPIAPNESEGTDNPAGRELNRRVELVIGR